MDELMIKDPKAGPEDRWKAYIEDEGRRRLGWGIFVGPSPLPSSRRSVWNRLTRDCSCLTHRWLRF